MSKSIALQHLDAEAEQRQNWFVHDRFGLFIHWGIFAAAARHG
jgi:alpha-L-fucosidase